MINSKYGDIRNKQFQAYIVSLHKSIHWLLIYKEQHYQKLNEYFDSLLFKLTGLSSILPDHVEIINLLSILEGARIESLKKDCNFKTYRKAILDAHSIVDKIGESLGGDDNE